MQVHNYYTCSEDTLFIQMEPILKKKKRAVDLTCQPRKEDFTAGSNIAMGGEGGGRRLWTKIR